MEGALKTIIQAGRDNIDFLAFLSIAIISAYCLISGVSLVAAIGLAIALCLCWILSRYALLRIQTHERLRDMRENASLGAKDLISRHATDDELDGLFENKDKDEPSV